MWKASPSESVHDPESGVEFPKGYMCAAYWSFAGARHRRREYVAAPCGSRRRAVARYRIRAQGPAAPLSRRDGAPRIAAISSSLQVWCPSDSGSLIRSPTWDHRARLRGSHHRIKCGRR